MGYDLTLAYGSVAYSGTAKGGVASKAAGWRAQIPDAAVPFSTSTALTTGTIEMWINGTVSALQIFASHPNLWWWGTDASGNLIVHYGQFQPSSNELTLASTTNVATGAWVHVALVFNFVAGVGSISLYAAGNRVATSSVYSAPGAPIAPGCVLGGLLSTNNGFNWPGLIDDVIITNGAKYTGATYTVPASPAPVTAPNQLAYYAFDNTITDTNVTAAAAISQPSVSGLVAGGSSTISGTFSVGAPTSLSQVLDGTTTAVSGPTISTTSGTGATAAGTYSYTITTPAAGAHSIQVNGVGTYAATGSAAAFTTTTAVAAATILPNDANIIYSPGCWDATAVRAKTIQAGAYFRTLIAGSATAITLGFDVSGAGTPLSEVMARVDRGPWQVANIAGSIVVALPGGNTWASRLLEVVVKSTSETIARWSTQATGVLFTGITTTPGTCSTVAIQAKPMRGLVFGDSITEGVRALNLSATNDTDRNDASVGWAYGLGDLVGAELGVVGFGATGWITAGSGGVPAFPSSYTLLWGSGPSRSFAGLDFIVVNHGTNDGSSSTTSAITSVLNGLLTAAPAAMVFLMRPFGGTNQTANLLAGRLACTNPQRVVYVDTAGWLSGSDSSDGTHPYGYVSIASLAPRLAAVIRATLRGVPNRWSHS